MTELPTPWTEAEQYDAMIRWDARRGRELPFYQRHFGSRRRILDVACGTGHQALWLAQAGYEVEGCDLFPKMLDTAIRHADEAGAAIRFFLADMRDLSVDRTYDGILCVGNALTALGDCAHLRAFFSRLANVLTPNGVFVFQILNFVSLLREGRRYEPVRSGTVAGRETLLLKMFDFTAPAVEGLAVGRVELAAMWREPEGWKSRVHASPMPAFLAADITSAAAEAGLELVTLLGDHVDHPYDPDRSVDLIGVLRRPA